MKVIHHNEPFLHVTLEDVFSSRELEIVHEEIKGLKQYFGNPDVTGTALSQDDEPLKKGDGIFLLQLDYESKITKFINKRIKQIGKSEWKNPTFRRVFHSLVWGNELLNCYKGNDYYKPHFDHGVLTLVFFLWEDTSTFDGGDLYFPEYDYIHKCNNNHAILSNSKEIHGVTPLVTKDETSTRYSIVTFSVQNETQSLHDKWKDFNRKSSAASISFLYQ
jgi:hypothetical protein